MTSRRLRDRNPVQRIILCVVVILTLCLCGCASEPQAVLKMPKNPVFRLSSYAFDSAKPLEERIEPVPDVVLEYLERMDGRSYANYTPTTKEIDMISAYLGTLLPLHRRVLRERLVGIYFLDPFLGGGLSEYVLDENDEIFAFMAFNAETLHLDLSAWITYRDNTAFRPGDGQTIRAECGTEYTGFMHILLHEATHVVDFVEGITPYLRNSIPSSVGSRGRLDAKTPFTSGIWRDYTQVHQPHDFPLRPKITFYGLHGGPHLSIREAETVYGQLASSPFVSLYASISGAEDLAELVAWYHLSEVLNQPHRIICSAPQRADRVFEFKPRAVTSERRAVIEAFYRDNDSAD